jgi:hypothetical protein
MISIFIIRYTIEHVFIMCLFYVIHLLLHILLLFLLNLVKFKIV